MLGTGESPITVRGRAFLKFAAEKEGFVRGLQSQESITIASRVSTVVCGAGRAFLRK
jgi:hypothetical protein